MEETRKQLDKLALDNESKINALKRDQASKFQHFKMKCQQDFEKLKEENLKEIEAFRESSKKRIAECEERHVKENDGVSPSSLKEFEEEFRKKKLEEIEEQIKQKKVEDKQELKDKDNGDTMLSQADIEIFKAAQLQERKELKKKLKAEVEDLVAAELKKQANNVQIKNLEELFDLKLTLLDEEEALHKKLQTRAQKLQTAQQEEEQKMLIDNLNIIQSGLEENLKSEHDLQKETVPVSNQAMLDKYTAGINEMIATKEADIKNEKEKAEQDYAALLKQYKEDMETLAQPPKTADKAELKKAFLTRKFDIKHEPPSEDKLKEKLKSLDNELQHFKEEKMGLIDIQKTKIESLGQTQLSELVIAEKELQAANEARVAKLLSIQKEEREKVVVAQKAADEQHKKKWEEEKATLLEQKRSGVEAIKNPVKQNTEHTE